MTFRWFKIVLSLLMLITSFSSLASDHAGKKMMVLVTSFGSKMPTLSKQEVRKLFLGFPVTKNSQIIISLSNRTDELLYEVFLQKIIFMSSRIYERQLMSRVLKYGGNRPKYYLNNAKLVEALKSNEHMVTFMWRSTVATTPGIKILQPLWQGALE